MINKRHTVRTKKIGLFTLSLLILLSVYAPVTFAEESSFVISNKNNPYTRTVLFDLNQGKYPSAIGYLMAERWRNKKDKERYQSELLLAYSYISYRMHDEAEKILNALPKKMPSNETNNKNVLWMEIAKTRFRSGDLKSAQSTLYKMDNNISNKLSREREVFQAQLLMKENKYDAAITELEKTRGSSEWSSFARYNLGVMLVRSGDEARGIKKLETVARIEPDEPEMKALKDKANYTLGYIQLRNKKPDIAKRYFQKIRLESPLSNKALMYLGLAYSDLEKHKQSLAAWLELSERDTSDPTVLESMLAIPFAYAELGGLDQAVKKYENAIKTYRAEIKRIDAAIRSTKKGYTINAILEQMGDNKSSSLENKDVLPITKQSRYLSNLYISNEFQQAIKNNKDLRNLENKLKIWTFAIYQVTNMSKTFKKVYVDKIAKQQSRLATAASEIKKHLKKLALTELRDRKSKLNTYIKQAQFATAQIYDKGRPSRIR